MNQDHATLNRITNSWGSLEIAMYELRKEGWDDARLSAASGYSEEVVDLMMQVQYILSGDRARDKEAE